MVTWVSLFLFFAVSALFIVRPFLGSAERSPGKLKLATRTDELRTALEAIDRDEAAGLITVSTAEQSRIQIAEDYESYVAEGEASETDSKTASPKGTVAAFGAVAVLGAVAATTYALAGTPGFRDHPLDWRIENDVMVGVAHNVDRMESYLAQNPEDATAWAMIAPIYFEFQEWGKAAHAYLSAARYGKFNDLQKSQLLVMATRSMLGETEGLFTEPSKIVAEAAARFDPQNVQARFLKADAVEQTGAPEDAVSEWESLLEAFPSDTAGFRDIAVQRLSLLRAKISDGGVSAPVRGPTEEQMDAAADLSGEDRAIMIEGMVERLANRLEDDPSNIEGWLRLIRSYTVLGRTDDAQAALERAQNSLQSNSDALRRLSSLAQELSLEP